MGKLCRGNHLAACEVFAFWCAVYPHCQDEQGGGTVEEKGFGFAGRDRGGSLCSLSSVMVTRLLSGTATDVLPGCERLFYEWGSGVLFLSGVWGQCQNLCSDDHVGECLCLHYHHQTVSALVYKRGSRGF